MTGLDVPALIDSARAQLSQGRADLEDLVRIRSISAESGDPEQVLASAQKVYDLLAPLGLDPQILRASRPDGSPGAPAVVGRRPAPTGAPTVMLYAHHDVQPVTAHGWDTDPFVATEVDGRLYGRGTADDKAGVMVHVTALRALLEQWGPDDGVGLVVFIEGEEEDGSPSFGDFLRRYRDLLACDVIVIADSDNWSVDDPSLTVSLRGLVQGTLEVATLSTGLHSGMFGGLVPDALMVLSTLLARLWDADGAVAVPGLISATPTDLAGDQQRLRQDAGVLAGVELIGRGPLLDRIWTQPAITVTGIDAPSVANASNTLVPRARAQVTLRIAPGQDADDAAAALTSFLTSTPPFGAQVEFTVADVGRPFAGDVDGPVYDAARWALSHAWGGAAVVQQGIGGSIPFVAELLEVFPDAKVLITGVEDPRTFAHGTNESLSLQVFGNAAVAETLLLARLADRPA